MPELTPEQRAQLDKNIRAMIAQGASEQDVMSYSNDYRKKYDIPFQEPVKKKEQSFGTGNYSKMLAPNLGSGTQNIPPSQSQYPSYSGNVGFNNVVPETSQKPNEAGLGDSGLTLGFKATDARVGGESKQPEKIAQPKTLGKALALGAASGASGLLKSIGIMAKELDWFDEYEGKTAQDLATYKAGKWIDDTVKDLVGDLSPEEQQNFSVKLAGGVGQMATMMLGGLGGKALKLSAPLTTATIGAASVGSSEWKNAIDSGATPDQAAKAFWLNSGFGLVTEGLPFMKAFRSIDKYSGGLATGVLAQKLASSAGGRITNEIAQGFIAEAAQEAAQQIVANAVAQDTYDVTRGLFDDVAESAALGGILGSTMRGVVSAIREKRTSGNLTAEEDAQLAKAEEFAISKIEEVDDPNKKEVTLSKEKVQEQKQEIAEQLSPKEKVAETEETVTPTQEVMPSENKFQYEETLRSKDTMDGGSDVLTYTLKSGKDVLGSVELHKYKDKGHRFSAVALNKEFRGSGIGKELYRDINRQSIEESGFPLWTKNNLLNEDSERVWKSLVKSGEAELVNGNYAFKPSKPTSGIVEEGVQENPTFTEREQEINEPQASQPTTTEEVIPPPIEPPSAEPTKAEGGAIFSERPATELSFRGLQNVANEFGYEDVKSRDTVTDLQEMQNARETAQEWADKGEYQKNVDELLTKINDKQLVPTAKQRLILQQYLANESQKLRSITDKKSQEYNDQFEKVKRIKQIGQIARQEAGAALRIGDTRSHPVNDIVDATIIMEEAQGGEKLNEKQSEEVEKLVNDYEAKLKVAEQKVADMEKKFSDLEAQKKVDAEKKKVARKKSTDEYKKERQSIRESIKDKWEKAGKDETLSVTVPYAKQLMAIAPDVAKLMKSYIEEGITDFGEIIKKLHAEVQDVEPDVTEQDVSDILAGKYDKPKITKADLEKQLKQIKNKKSEEAVKIRARIKSGQFDKVARPTSWVDNPEFKNKYPKEYKEAIDALDAKEQAQLDFDIAVYKAERAKRSKVTKGIDLARSIIATTKAVKSGIDDSAVMMQNIVAMMSHPRSAVRALKEHALDAVSEKRFRRYLTELHNSPMWPLIEQSGLSITDPKSLKEQNKEEIFDNNLLNKDFKIGNKKYNVGKYLTRPFERAFTSLGNAMRVNMFTHVAGRWLEEGRTFEKNPEDFKSLAALLNTQTGRGKLHTQVERASQLVTAGIWSPRLMASRLNMLGISELGRLYGAKGFYQGLTPEIRKMAIGDMTKFIGAGVALMGFAALAGADIDDDPESPTFGTIKIGDKKYNAWGGFTPYVKTIYQGIKGQRKIGGEVKEVTRGKLVGQFFRSRLTPAAGVTTDLLTGKDFSGKPITPLGEVANLVAPLSINAVIDGVEKDGAAGLLLQGLPSFVGIGVSDERDFQKKEDRFKIYQKSGTKVREATPDEVIKLKEDKEKIYQEELKKAEANKGWGFNKYGELTTDDDAIKKKGVYEKLSEEDKEELQSRLKTSATYQAKKKIKY